MRLRIVGTGAHPQRQQPFGLRGNLPYRAVELDDLNRGPRGEQPKAPGAVVEDARLGRPEM